MFDQETNQITHGRGGVWLGFKYPSQMDLKTTFLDLLIESLK